MLGFFEIWSGKQNSLDLWTKDKILMETVSFLLQAILLVLFNQYYLISTI